MITTVVPSENQPVAPPTPIEVLLQQTPLTMLQATGTREINAIKDPAESTEMSSATGSDEVLSLPGDYFTVQLIAMKNEQKVLEYATDNGIENPLYVRILSQDINWYVLLLGTYADQSAANDAKADWEETRVLEVKPWTRRLSPLQDAIRLALDR
jgi:septal ring-binding cell division protein DamX